MKTILCVSIVFVGLAANVARANYLSPTQDATCEAKPDTASECQCFLDACNAAYGTYTEAAATCVTVDSGSTTCSPE